MSQHPTGFSPSADIRARKPRQIGSAQAGKRYDFTETRVRRFATEKNVRGQVQSVRDVTSPRHHATANYDDDLYRRLNPRQISFTQVCLLLTATSECRFVVTESHAKIRVKCAKKIDAGNVNAFVYNLNQVVTLEPSQDPFDILGTERRL